MLILSFSIQRRPQKLFKYELKEFHTNIVGEDSVNNFHRIFPFIVSNDYVYLAYLQREYVNTNKKQINQLIRNDYYKRTMSRNIQRNRSR